MDKKRVAIYNRCSTEEEAQLNALNIQVKESLEIANSKNWLVVGQYVESESGTSINRRIQYQKLLRDMELGRFDIIMIKSIDRLTRSTKDWYIFLDKLISNNIKLYIYIDNKYYSTEDSLVNGIKAILAEDFSRELSKKIKNAHKRRQEKHTGMNITTEMFGWDKIEKDKYVINEIEAQYYRKAFELARMGKGFYSIANTMYDMGARSKNNKKISQVQWRKMLLSPHAHGTHIMHMYEKDFETGKRNKVDKSKWIYVDNVLPPIISYEEHMEVLKNLESRTSKHIFKGYTRDMSKVGKYPLSGKLYCDKCGSKYYRTIVNKCGEKRVIWKCATAVNNGMNLKGCNNVSVEECKVYLEIYKKMTENVKINVINKKNGEEIDAHTIAYIVCALFEKIYEDENVDINSKEIAKDIEKLRKKQETALDKLLEGVISNEDYRKWNEIFSEKIEGLGKRIEEIKNKEDNDIGQYIALKEKRIVESITCDVLDDKNIVMQAAAITMLQDIDRIKICENRKIIIV